MAEKQTAGIGKGTPGPGRKKGVPNKQTAAVKDMILAAFGIGGCINLIALGLAFVTAAALVGGVLG